MRPDSHLLLCLLVGCSISVFLTPIFYESSILVKLIAGGLSGLIGLSLVTVAVGPPDYDLD